MCYGGLEAAACVAAQAGGCCSVRREGTVVDFPAECGARCSVDDADAFLAESGLEEAAEDGRLPGRGGPDRRPSVDADTTQGPAAPLTPVPAPKPAAVSGPVPVARRPPPVAAATVGTTLLPHAVPESRRLLPFALPTRGWDTEVAPAELPYIGPEVRRALIVALLTRDWEASAAAEDAPNAVVTPPAVSPYVVKDWRRVPALAPVTRGLEVEATPAALLAGMYRPSREALRLPPPTSRLATSSFDVRRCLPFRLLVLLRCPSSTPPRRGSLRSV